MKMPGKVRSMIDEMEGLSSSDKAKLVRHLNDMADSLPEHPTPAEAKRIVNGALKSLKIVVGKDDEPKKEEPKKEKKEEPKEEPKKEKKEAVKESAAPRKLTFKAFLSEAGTIEYRIEDSDVENYDDAIQFDLKMAKMPSALAAKIKALNIDEDYFSEDGFTIITLHNKDKEKLKKLFDSLGYVEVKKFS